MKLAQVGSKTAYFSPPRTGLREAPIPMNSRRRIPLPTGRTLSIPLASRRARPSASAGLLLLWAAAATPAAAQGSRTFAARADVLWRRATGIQRNAPAVSAVTPDHGPNSGASVVITGTGFTAASAVSFGPDAASFTVDSDTEITATLGA